MNFSPKDHTLCGTISYTGNFNGTPVDGDPLDYATDTRIFTADSEDRDLIGKAFDYSVVATLTSYQPSVFPTASTVTGTGEITFVDPCLNPFTFDSTAQNDAT